MGSWTDGRTHARTDAFSKNAFLKTPFRERNPKKKGVRRNSRAFCLARTESIPVVYFINNLYIGVGEERIRGNLLRGRGSEAKRGPKTACFSNFGSRLLSKRFFAVAFCMEIAAVISSAGNW